MNIIQSFYKIFYLFQYSKYVRALPFYLARECGIKNNYSSKEIDEVLKKYHFNLRYSPIAYALYGHGGQYAINSEKWRPCPERTYIRDLIAKKYQLNEVDLNMCQLLQLSIYKLSGHNDLGINTSEEYYKYLEKCRVKYQKPS